MTILQFIRCTCYRLATMQYGWYVAILVREKQKKGRNFSMKFIKQLLIFLCVAQTGIARDKVLIVTCSYTRPDFIEIQSKTFKAFMQDEYEFIVFDDAPDAPTSNAIKNMCKKLSITHQRIPQVVHMASNRKQIGNFVRSSIPVYIDEQRGNVSCRASDSLNYLLQNVAFNHEGIVCLVDSDLFLIKKFSIADFMQEYDLYGCIQQRNHITYLWTGLMLFNNAKLPNKHTLTLDCGKVDGVGVDTGGHLHCYLQENKSLRIGFYSNTHIDDLPKDANALQMRGYTQPEAQFIMNNPSRMEFHIDNNFLHYCAGGNWDKLPQQYHINKTKVLNSFIDSILTNH